MLLAHGGDPNATNVGEDGGWGAPAVYVATEQNHVEAVKMLLESNGDPNKLRAKDGSGPLYAAADHGSAVIAQLLLRHGADMHAVTRDTGASPLAMAAHRGNIGVLRVLLEHNVNPDQRSHDDLEETAILIAVGSGNIECIQLLLEYSADPGIPSKAGVTPLAEATRRGHKAIADLLRKPMPTPI